jgi:endonuclease YncB( thermonuclease family)
MVSTRFWAFAVSLALVGCAPAASQPSPPAAEAPPPPLALGFHIARDPVELRDVRVYDGDTFDSGLERFRPDNLDTPELGDKAHCPLEQARAEQARDEARRIFAEAQTIIATPTDNRRDRYGRVLARITVDGRDYGEMLQEMDLARPYRRPPGWNWCATPVVECAANSDVCGRASRRSRQP